jgi:hypothetical protein
MGAAWVMNHDADIKWENDKMGEKGAGLGRLDESAEPDPDLWDR